MYLGCLIVSNICIYEYNESMHMHIEWNNYLFTSLKQIYKSYMIYYFNISLGKWANILKKTRTIVIGSVKKNGEKQLQQLKKESSVKYHYCLCRSSSCPYNASSSSSPSSTITTTTQTKDNRPRSMTFTADPLYVRFMEYNILKKRVAAIEKRENH